MERGRRIVTDPRLSTPDFQLRRFRHVPNSEGDSGIPGYDTLLPLLLRQVDNAAVHLVLLHLLDAMQQGAVALIFQHHQTPAPHLQINL